MVKSFSRSRANKHAGSTWRRPASGNPDRDRDLRAVDTVCELLPACPDCDNGGHSGHGPDGYCPRRTVLAILFQEPYRTPPGSTPRTLERVRRYNGLDTGERADGGAS